MVKEGIQGGTTNMKKHFKTTWKPTTVDRF